MVKILRCGTIADASGQAHLKRPRTRGGRRSTLSRGYARGFILHYSAYLYPLRLHNSSAVPSVWEIHAIVSPSHLQNI